MIVVVDVVNSLIVIFKMFVLIEISNFEDVVIKPLSNVVEVDVKVIKRQNLIRQINNVVKILVILILVLIEKARFENLLVYVEMEIDD